MTNFTGTYGAPTGGLSGRSKLEIPRQPVSKPLSTKEKTAEHLNMHILSLVFPPTPLYRAPDSDLNPRSRNPEPVGCGFV